MIDVKTIKRRFLTLNQERLRRARAVLRPRQREALDILPLLFHANHPSFPGYVGPDTPAGISGYHPHQTALLTARKMVKSFAYKRRAQPRYDIHALYMMGSSGTIAYSDKSDFDIWLCHAPDLDAGQLEELQQKCHGIEAWAADLSLEVHFFLMNAPEFAAGKGVALSGESSGSAQHHLLLDEFYRTALVLAGRYPLWWFVPVEEEVDYARYSQNLIRQRLLHENDVIDFGGLPEAPAEEFFGASLWQLYKSIDSPYKAALKLLLMEYYASVYPQLKLLCLDYKRAVHAGEHDLSKLDPYLMLYRTTAAYLQDINDGQRLDLLRKCFYYKVNEDLGRPDRADRDNWRRETMRRMVEEWGWDQAMLERLDSRPSWRIDRVQKEQQQLIEALSRSYQALSDFARSQSTLSRISQQDLNVLGRKLYASFERKPGKVLIVNRGISEDVQERQVTLCQQQLSNGGSQWALFRGAGNMTTVTHTPPLHRTPTLVELLTWCHLNGVIGDHTALSVRTSHGEVTVGDVRAIRRCLEKALTRERFARIPADAMSRPRRLARHLLIVNVGAPLQQGRQGQCLTSSKVDALSYGGVCENQVLTLDHVTVSSWQEVVCRRYEGIAGIFALLDEALQWSRQADDQMPWPAPEVFCFSPGHGQSIARRVGQLVVDVEAAFRDPERCCRYFLTIGRHLYQLWHADGRLQHQRLESYDELKQQLGQGRPAPGTVVFDRHCLCDDLLPGLYRHARAGSIHLFHVVGKGVARLFVIDAHGALFTAPLPQGRSETALRRLKTFLEQSRCHPHPLDVSTPPPPPEITCHQVVDHRGELHVQTIPDRVVDGLDTPPGLVVESIVNERGRPEFTLRLGERTFSSREIGDGLFEAVAAALLDEHRIADPGFGLRIERLESSPELLGLDRAEQVQGVHLLRYRQRIEIRIENAIANLRGHIVKAS